MHPVLVELSQQAVGALFGALGGAVLLGWLADPSRGGKTGFWLALLVGLMLGGSAGAALAPRGASLPGYSYGVMLAASLVCGLWLTRGLAARDARFAGVDINRTYVVTALFAITCARLLFIATNFEAFASPARWFSLADGGLVAYGGFLGGLLGAQL